MEVLIIAVLALLASFCAALHQEDFKPSARMNTRSLKIALVLDVVIVAFMTWILPNTTMLYAMGVFGCVAMYDVARWLGARHYNRKEGIDE